MFVFGSSYSSLGFNLTQDQPSAANPLGNPAYPGLCNANGPNWVDFLTTTYNASFLETIDFAISGTTIDAAIVKPSKADKLSLYGQINEEFLPVYSTRPSFFPWTSRNTLFASFMGMKDVGIFCVLPNASDILAADIAEYASLMDVLYQNGARNFLFLNVLAINRAPLTLAEATKKQSLEASYIAAYNDNITAMATNLSTAYTDATTFVFDTNAIFNEVLDNPCSYPQTCAYLNTTQYCVDYETGTSDWYTFLPECGIPVDEYFWLNSLHPTFRMHNATAAAIADQSIGS